MLQNENKINRKVKIHALRGDLEPVDYFLVCTQEDGSLRTRMRWNQAPSPGTSLYSIVLHLTEVQLKQTFAILLLIILTTLLFSIYYHPILQKEELRCKDYLVWGQRVDPVDPRQRIRLSVKEMWVRSLGQEDPLEMEMAAYSSILAWEIPRTEELASVGWGGGQWGARCDSLWGPKESGTT